MKGENVEVYDSRAQMAAERLEEITREISRLERRYQKRAKIAPDASGEQSRGPDSLSLEQKQALLTAEITRLKREKSDIEEQIRVEVAKLRAEKTALAKKFMQMLMGEGAKDKAPQTPH